MARYRVQSGDVSGFVDATTDGEALTRFFEGVGEHERYRLGTLTEVVEVIGCPRYLESRLIAQRLECYPGAVHHSHAESRHDREA